MSANLDLVRSIFVEWERGDFNSAEWFHPEVEFVIADGPDPGSSTGLTELARSARELLRTWEHFRPEAEDYRELDSERVLVLWRYNAQGRTSGLDTTRMTGAAAHVFHVMDGKVTRVVFYIEGKHALAELGLNPEGRHR
jgi:ketosteroid isomerase-like protein